MTEQNLRQLAKEGYTILRGVLDLAWLEELRQVTEHLLKKEGQTAGAEFRQEFGSDRLANLLDKGACFERLICHPEILQAVESVLGVDWKVSSLNYRSALPGNNGLQPLHCDMGLVPDDRGFSVFNSVWMLDDFTPRNGPTRFVPETHRSGVLPQNSLVDPNAPHPKEVLGLGHAGDVILTNAHMWHGGTSNQTDLPRRSLHGFYVRGDKPQQQYQKKLLSRLTQDRLSPKLRQLLALDDPRNDFLSEKGSGKSGFLK